MAQRRKEGEKSAVGLKSQSKLDEWRWFKINDKEKRPPNIHDSWFPLFAAGRREGNINISIKCHSSNSIFFVSSCCYETLISDAQMMREWTTWSKRELRSYDYDLQAITKYKEAVSWIWKFRKPDIIIYIQLFYSL